MNNNYRVTNESLAREQFEIFMKDVYDKVDSLSVDIDKELLTVFTNLSLVGEEYKYDQKIADKVIKAANKTPEFGTKEFFDQYTINELKTIAKDNKLTIMPKSKKEDIIALIVTSKIDYSKIPTSSKIAKGINASVSKYLNVKDSTYIGLGGEIKKYTNKVLSKLDTLDEYADRKTYGVYSSILDNLNKLSLELNKFKKYSGVYQKKIELINLYKKEVEKYDELINKALEDFKSSKSDVEKVFIQNQIKAYKDTKANFENNIVSYENEIKSSVSKDLNGLSALEYSNYLTGLVDNVWNEFRRGFADDSIAIDVDADTYKMFKTSYTYVKGDIESIFSKVVSKETELNELCSKYGISKEVEEVKEGPKFFNKPSEEVKEEEPSVVKQEEPKEENLVINNDKLTYAASMLTDSKLYSEDDINRILQDLNNVKTTDEVNNLVKYIIDNKWNVRDAETVIDNYLDRLERGEIIAAEDKQSIKIESGKLTSAKQMLIDSKLYSEDDINRILQDLNNVKTAEEINNLVKRIIDNKWNVRNAEDVIDNYLDEVERAGIADRIVNENSNLEAKNEALKDDWVWFTKPNLANAYYMLTYSNKFDKNQVADYMKKLDVIGDSETVDRVAKAIIEQDLDLDKVQLLVDEYQRRQEKKYENKFVQPQDNLTDVNDLVVENAEELEKATEEVNSIEDPVLLKPRTPEENYEVYGDGKFVVFNDQEEAKTVETPEEVTPEEYDNTLKDRIVDGINKAGDKFVAGANAAGDKLVAGAKVAGRVAKNMYIDANDRFMAYNKAKNEARKAKFKASVMKLLSPAMLTYHKGRALAAAVNNKVHEWASEDFKNQFDEAVNDDRGVSR